MSRCGLSKLGEAFGIRHLQFVLLFFTVVLIYSHRTVLSIAIIAMTSEVPLDPSIPTYPDWDNRAIILSSFFWGYILFQVPAGQVGERFGPKWFLCGATVMTSLFSICIPMMAGLFGSTGVIVCRVIQGISQGFVFPSVHILISRWCPSSERSRVSAFIYSGTSMGISTSMIFTGILCSTSWGWPSAFYVYGGCGLVWSTLLGLLVSNSPAVHPRISKEEKALIESNTSVCCKEGKKVPTPWSAILTSLPTWAILVTNTGESWGSFTLLTEIPTYLTTYMSLDIASNSAFSALPYVSMFVMCLIGGFTADKLILSKLVTIGATRKLFNLIGTMTPALALFSLGFMDSSQQNLAIALLIVAVGATGFNQSASTPNIIDLAPNHAGTLQGIINGASNVASILGTLCVGFLGSDMKDPVLWKKVFWLAAGFYVFCGGFFFSFSSGETQKWNDLECAEKSPSEERNGEEIA